MTINLTATGSWWFLFLAGICEIIWIIGLKYSEGFTKPLPIVTVLIASLLSILSLSQAIKNIPIGTAYTIWTGMGVLGTVLFGVIWLKEPTNIGRLFFISLIFIGIAGIKISEG